MIAAAAVTVAVTGYWVVKATHFPIHDFANTYFGAQFFRQGIFDTGVFDPYTFNKRIADAGFSGIFASFNPNPPFVAWFFVPLTFLSLPISKLAFNVLSVALFLVSVYRFASFLKIDRSIVLLTLPLIFFIPIRNQILFGQSYFLLLFLLMEGILAYERRKFVWANAFWAIAIFIKIFPAVILLWLAVRRDWRNLFGLGGWCLFLLGVSISLQGVEVWRVFLLDILPPHQQGLISAEYTPYQTAYMFLKYHLVGEPLLNPVPWIDSWLLMQLCLAIFSAACITLICSFASQKGSILSFSYLLAISILLSPYGSSYGLLLLAPLWLVATKELPKNKSIAFHFLIFLICNVPLGLLQKWGFNFPRLTLLILAIGLISFYLKVTIRWAYALVAIPLILLALSRTIERSSDRILANEDHSLIFDYEIRDGQLIYKYWNETGENTFATHWAVANVVSNGLEIRDNQITLLNRKLTSSPDRKLKPTLINGDTVVFLSDHGKGRGFYTLRYVTLSR